MWQEVVRGAGVPTGNRPNLKVQMDAPRLGSAPGITDCPFLFYVSRSIEVARQGHAKLCYFHPRIDRQPPHSGNLLPRLIFRVSELTLLSM